jgi:hypothetical protein
MTRIAAGLRLVSNHRRVELVLAATSERPARQVNIVAKQRPFSWWVRAVLLLDQIDKILGRRTSQPPGNRVGRAAVLRCSRPRLVAIPFYHAGTDSGCKLILPGLLRRPTALAKSQIKRRRAANCSSDSARDGDRTKVSARREDRRALLPVRGLKCGQSPTGTSEL